MTRIIGKDTPPAGDWGGLVFSWERCLDPWHADAFPPEFRYVGTTGPRREGWEGLDWCGNCIIFVPDGTREVVNE